MTSSGRLGPRPTSLSLRGWEPTAFERLKSPSSYALGMLEKDLSFTLRDLEDQAQTRVEARAWAYLQGGAAEERTLRWNRVAFERRTLRPRVLRDVGHVETGSRILERPVAAPFFVSPTAQHGLFHPEAEEGVARACASRGILAVYSTLSTRSLESIAQAAPNARRWFQLYVHRDTTQWEGGARLPRVPPWTERNKSHWACFAMSEGSFAHFLPCHKANHYWYWPVANPVSRRVNPPPNHRPHRGGEKPFQEPHRDRVDPPPRTVLGAGTSRSNPSWAASSGRASRMV